jgi:protein-L-isoaspartate(D-aspartate) O-methyltransferase
MSGGRERETGGPIRESPPPDRYALVRALMVREQLRARGIADERVLAAMAVVPRERFVAAGWEDRAHDDAALPIAAGQTISQPYVVARMTEALRVGVGAAVLEVGTGSGYQAAVLAELGAHVVSVERHAELARAARARLGSLGYAVEVVVGDGSRGWPPRAPYRGIVVTAAAPDVPDALLAQLEDGGRLVIPVGSRGQQELRLLERRGKRLIETTLEPVVFVPLVGRHGFER